MKRPILRPTGLFPWGAFSLALIAIAVWCFPSVASHFELDRGVVFDGEPWRLVTGHFAHTSTSHLFWDVLMFVALGVAVERGSRSAFWITVTVSSLAISFAVLWLEPTIDIYRGLSGIDSALFGWWAMHHLARLWRAGNRSGVLLLGAAGAAFAGKLVYELHTAHAFFVDSSDGEMLVVPMAHAVGAVVGALIARFSMPQSIELSRTLPASPHLDAISRLSLCDVVAASTSDPRRCSSPARKRRSCYFLVEHEVDRIPVL